jgi:NADPH:quinone reductase
MTVSKGQKKEYVEASPFGGPEVLKVTEKETPRPAEDMLLVEVQAAGINYADLLARAGHYPAIAHAPFVVGFEVAGIVIGVGTGVVDFRVGDTVAPFRFPAEGTRNNLDFTSQPGSREKHA